MNYAEALNQIADDLRYFRERQERIDAIKSAPPKLPPPPVRTLYTLGEPTSRRRWWKR